MAPVMVNQTGLRQADKIRVIKSGPGSDKKLDPDPTPKTSGSDVNTSLNLSLMIFCEVKLLESF